jgi:hypothetical protein
MTEDFVYPKWLIALEERYLGITEDGVPQNQDSDDPFDVEEKRRLSRKEKVLARRDSSRNHNPRRTYEVGRTRKHIRARKGSTYVHNSAPMALRRYPNRKRQTRLAREKIHKADARPHVEVIQDPVFNDVCLPDDLDSNLETMLGLKKIGRLDRMWGHWHAKHHQTFLYLLQVMPVSTTDIFFREGYLTKWEEDAVEASVKVVFDGKTPYALRGGYSIPHRLNEYCRYDEGIEKPIRISPKLAEKLYHMTEGNPEARKRMKQLGLYSSQSKATRFGGSEISDVLGMEDVDAELVAKH